MRALVLVSILFCTSLNAQTIFAPIGAKWTYEERFAFINDSALVTIESVADTMMLGHTCKVLEVTGQIYCTQMYRYVYASNDTVFFWEPLANMFSVLYVMDAVPGQTWDMMVSCFGMGAVAGVTNTSGSTTVISGQTLRVLNNSVDLPGMAYYGTGTVIERLGDLRFMFPWSSGACDGDYITTLRCYEDSSIAWLNPMLQQCDLVTSIDEDGAKDNFLIAPSLAEAGEAITLSTSDASIRSFRVIDMTGRTVMTGSFVNRRATLQLMDAGAYMVMPEPIGTSVAQRIVVR